jgi:ABC-type transport system involved in multi-copper enzyme maturation permease subunit
MNMTIVNQLIQKDWEMNKGPLMGYMILGAIALWLFIIESYAAFMTGLIMLISVVIIIAIHMVISTVVNERKNQTLTFIMSLPVSFKEYTLAKVLSNWIVVGTAWLILYLSFMGVILLLDNVPDGFVPYGTMTMLYLLCIYAVLIATAMIAENEIVTVVVMTIANISISIFMMAVASNDSIGPFIEGSEPVWNGPTLAIMGAQFSVIILSVVLTFYFQSKKRNYL